jgi:hypothetical protein
MRAADLGYAPRFLSFFLAWAFHRFDGESTLPPQAANASRWAAGLSRFFKMRAIVQDLLFVSSIACFTSRNRFLLGNAA